MIIAQMTKGKKYWWRVDGKVVYGIWTGCHESSYLWMRTKDNRLWRVPADEVRECLG